MKRCPPGVICIENITVFLCFMVSFVILYFMFFTNSNQDKKESQLDERETNINTTIQMGNPYSYGTDVLQNPYEAPLKDDRYFVSPLVPVSPLIPPNAVPINISTTAIDTTYRQMGILTPVSGTTKDNILPLMGRPLFVRRSKYNYYAISNQHNNVKLPILVKGRSALNEYGVDEIFNGDTVYVEGSNEAYKVTMYENSVQRYLPFL